MVMTHDDGDDDENDEGEKFWNLIGQMPRAGGGRLQVNQRPEACDYDDAIIRGSL